jgi:hypothetical protein
VTASVPTLRRLLHNAQHRALHLETRDTYPVTDRYLAWAEGRDYDRAEFEQDWASCLAPLVSRAGDIRRARIVSEPLSSHTRYEYEVTERNNLKAGEKVRWLPRHEVFDILVPTNDYWLVDNDVLFNLFDGEGEKVGLKVITGKNNPRLIAVCNTAFEQVWACGVDHVDYKPR